MQVLTPPLNELPAVILKKVFYLSISSHQDLKVYKYVSKSLKEIVDDQDFLQSILSKLKGHTFGFPETLNYPENYLALDKDITHVFKSAYQNQNNHPLIKKISSVSLSNFASRTLVLKLDEEAVFYRLTTQERDSLDHVNSKERDGWKSCLQKIVERLLLYDFPLQIKLYFPSHSNYLARIEEKFASNKGMIKQLQEICKISDIFSCDESILVIDSQLNGPPYPYQYWIGENPEKQIKKNLSRYEMTYYTEKNNFWENISGNCIKDIDQVIDEFRSKPLVNDEKFNKTIDKVKKLPYYISFISYILSDISAYKNEMGPANEKRLNYWSIYLKLDETSKCVGIARLDCLWRNIQSTKIDKYAHLLKTIK